MIVSVPRDIRLDGDSDTFVAHIQIPAHRNLANVTETVLHCHIQLRRELVNPEMPGQCRSRIPTRPRLARDFAQVG